MVCHLIFERVSVTPEADLIRGGDKIQKLALHSAKCSVLVKVKLVGIGAKSKGRF